MNSTTAAPAIELIGLHKSFGGKKAVRDMNLLIPRGSTYGLLGPNGAGKTTTIRMALRIIEPDAGTIRVLGEPLTQQSLRRIGYLPEERGIYRQMRVKRLLQFFAELKGISNRDSTPRITSWLERFDLADRAQSKVQELSKGNQQKIQFISAILHEPEIMIFDEPFSGLDPLNQQVIKEIIVDLKRAGRTIVFSTHIIEHAERTCDHVCIMARSEQVANGTMKQVKSSHAENYVALTFDPWTAQASDFLKRSQYVASVRENGAIAELSLRPGVDPLDLMKQVLDANIRIKRFECGEPSLEQVFLEKVGAPEDIISEIEASHG